MYLTKIRIKGLSDIIERTDNIRKMAEEFDKEIKNLLYSFNDSHIELVSVDDVENKSDENNHDTLIGGRFGGFNI